ncbi:MAG: anti-sigma factor [Dehalococcoidia bacterium]
MSCDEINELLAAYALDALGPEELAMVDEHLASCRRHDEALAEHRTATASLSAEREPTPELRSRLLDAFDAEAASREPERPVELSAFRRVAEQRPAFWLAAAAVLLVAVVGLTTWGLVLQLEGGTSDSQLSAFAGEAGEGRLIYLPDDQIAIVRLELAAPDADHTYQAWGVFADQTLSLGLVPNDGVAAFRHDLSSAQAVAISVEPLGGSDQPTTDPVLVANVD